MRLGVLLALFAAATTAAQSVQAAAEAYELDERQTVTLPVTGATAAWPVDPSIVSVSIRPGGVVVVRAEKSGSTHVIISTVNADQSFSVAVRAPYSVVPHVANSSTKRSTVIESRYSTSGGQFQTSVATHVGGANRVTDVRIQNITYTREPELTNRGRTALPSVAVTTKRDGREFSLFDKAVDYSPLTLSGATIRGAHYEDAHWNLHAGVTAYATYDAFLLPRDREAAFGGGYTIPLGKRGQITPGFYLYPGKGRVASFLLDVNPSECFAARAELAYSRGLGGALQLRLDSSSTRSHLDARYEPEQFATVELRTNKGFAAEGDWWHSFGNGSWASVSAATANYLAIEQRTTAASFDSSWRLTKRLAVTSSPSWGTFNGVASLTTPVGLTIDRGQTGIAAVYRYARNGATNRGGSGYRISARQSFGRMYASAYVDRQNQAPTLGLIFDEQPELELALEQLGISVSSPADIARALRENKELLALGFIEGVTVDLSPRRTQSGVEMAFFGGTSARQQIRLRFLRNDMESISSHRVSSIATISYARSLDRSTDVFAAYSYWFTQTKVGTERVKPLVVVGLRHHFDELPSAFGSRTSVVAGRVFLDEDLDGMSDGPGVGDARIVIDGTEVAVTKSDGSFSVSGVRRGNHVVAAHLPAASDAFFTTPSKVEVAPGEKAAFGVAVNPARVFGTVTSDANVGVGGVKVSLSRGSEVREAITTSDGSFNLTAGPGDWEIGIVPDSIPAGFSLPSEAREIRLARVEPQRIELAVRANRSISGVAVPGTEVLVASKRVVAGMDGRFAIRGLPAGELVVVAAGQRKIVQLPAGPAALQVSFVGDNVSNSKDPGLYTSRNAWRVQIGTFNVFANAEAAATTVRKLGFDATILQLREYNVVRSGPYSRRDAQIVIERLAGQGIQAIAVAEKRQRPVTPVTAGSSKPN